jgi:hypothetical protein
LLSISVSLRDELPSEALLSVFELQLSSTKINVHILPVVPNRCENSIFLVGFGEFDCLDLT